MKTAILAISAFLALLTPSMAQTHLATGADLPAPNVTLKSVTGKSTTLKAAMQQNGLLVMFSCNTCPFVIKNQSITKQALTYAQQNNVGAVVINSNEAQRNDADSWDAMKQYASAQGYSVPYLVDDNSKMADLFGANHTPEVFLFNNKGKLIYKGAMNDNPGDPERYKRMYIQDAINNMIAGKAVDPDETKSIGCSIKRSKA